MFHLAVTNDPSTGEVRSESTHHARFGAFSENPARAGRTNPSPMLRKGLTHSP
jgi:hypothetical protein